MPELSKNKEVSALKGVVVSDKMEKTITVRIDTVTRHSVYNKVMGRHRKVKVHDEKNTAKTGDIVKIVQTRPLSKDKRYKLIEIVKKSGVEDVIDNKAKPAE